MIWIILGLWALGFVLLPYIPLCPTGTNQHDPTNISIIIPARNEEHNIRRLLASVDDLSAPPHEVIVVDDESTDRTAEVGRQYGVTVLSAPPLPAGWCGKSWACQVGANAATGEFLLFLDADTWLMPDALQRIHAATSPEECKGLTLGPYHEVERPYEQLSAIFNLMMHMGMGAFSLFDSTDDPHGLFGPFLFIDRQTYEEAGGHAAVRSDILEHMSFRAVLRKRHVAMRCLGGRGVVHTRMYPNGLASLVEGWTKAFAAGASQTKPWILWLSVAWMTGAVLSTVFSILAVVDATQPMVLAATYPAYAASLYIMLRQIGRFSIGACLLYPVLLLAFFFIFTRSAFARLIRRQVTWKGRFIDTAGRRGC